jgi:hypothetical protein
MSWTDPQTGEPHPESYWRISDFKVEHVNNGTVNTAATHVHISGWQDVAAHDAAKEPIFVKHYELAAGEIDFTDTIGDGYDGIYAYAQSIPDPETGVSFFDGATTV